MKRMMRRMMGVTMLMGSLVAFSQSKIDEQRMEQDIEVAENILSTLIRQQFGKRNFFPMEVDGNYLAGYGVTLKLPQGGAFNMFMYKSSDMPGETINVTPDGMTYNYSYSYSKSDSYDKGDSYSKSQRDEATKDKRKAVLAKEKAEEERAEHELVAPRAKAAPRARVNSDSAMITANKRFLEVAKNFLADYGDVIGQLKPDERIVVTNRGEEFGGDFGFRWPGGESRRNLISVEGKRDDITQLKQGKITRDQFISRLKIINTETSDKLDPDLEVLSSMFSRLYREDLSKTYYSQGDVSYERLKDFGVIYYMRVYSSNEIGDERFDMPTLAMSDMSKPERDKKVKELYPRFESELKDNLVEYGRTLRSLNSNEQVVFTVKLTRCAECGIPATLEISVNDQVLKDYSAGKITKEAALAKVNVKKTGMQ